MKEGLYSIPVEYDFPISYYFKKYIFISESNFRFTQKLQR